MKSTVPDKSLSLEQLQHLDAAYTKATPKQKVDMFIVILDGLKADGIVAKDQHEQLRWTAKEWRKLRK